MSFVNLLPSVSSKSSINPFFAFLQAIIIGIKVIKSKIRLTKIDIHISSRLIPAIRLGKLKILVIGKKAIRKKQTCLVFSGYLFFILPF